MKGKLNNSDNMKTLLLMRHAKSSWKDPGRSDHDRPLNDRGERAAPRMGRWLVEQSLIPEMIASSTALRAQRTTELVRQELIDEPQVATFSQLYLSDEETYLETIQATPDTINSLLVVGHNPTLEYLHTCLTGVAEPFPTGAIACIQCEVDSWFDLQLNQASQLVLFCRPRELDRA